MNQQVAVADSPISTADDDVRGSAKTKRVLAVASGGGHWVQLKRLWHAFDGHALTVVTTDPGYRDEVRCHAFRTVTDANMNTKFRLARLALEMAWIVFREQPDVVISTGAAPGYFALRFGKLVNARTIWVDSLANAEQLSLSGLKVRPHADLWLTQWEHLAEEDGPYYFGSVA